MAYGNHPEWDGDDIREDLLLLNGLLSRMATVKWLLRRSQTAIPMTKASLSEFADMLDDAEHDTIAAVRDAMSVELVEREVAEANRTERGERLNVEQLVSMNGLKP